ncbi:hypothetical protein ACFWBZ_32120, partial [Streptomyces griseus]|uniref:hypothetical protein n=1 Tax=Streptomyces griseus TaxID=1911 RepID=UPI0036977BEA
AGAYAYAPADETTARKSAVSDALTNHLSRLLSRLTVISPTEIAAADASKPLRCGPGRPPSVLAALAVATVTTTLFSGGCSYGLKRGRMTAAAQRSASTITFEVGDMSLSEEVSKFSSVTS